MAPSRSMVTLRSAPLPGPAPAANTTTSAAPAASVTSAVEACSRSQPTARPPAASISGAGSGLGTSPTTSSPPAASSLTSLSPICPWAPAITTRMSPHTSADMGQHRQDAAVPVLGVGDAELEQDVTDVGLHRALAEVQPLGDPGVGEPLGHQTQHLPLTL